MLMESNAMFVGNPYLHDRRANKTCTTRKRLQNHTPRNPSLKLLCVLFSYSLLCPLLGGRWWQSSVFRSMILFWISSAIQQQTPLANTKATGAAASCPCYSCRHHAKPVGLVLPRVLFSYLCKNSFDLMTAESFAHFLWILCIGPALHLLFLTLETTRTRTRLEHKAQDSTSPALLRLQQQE